MFDFNIEKLLFIVVIALIVFGPRELPKIAQQAGRALRDLRRIAEGATADLREGLGPEYQDFDFNDLNPRRFVQRHLLDDLNEATKPLYDEFNGTAATTGSANGAGAASANGAAVANDTRPALPDGAEPPFDIDAT